MTYHIKDLLIDKAFDKTDKKNSPDFLFDDESGILKNLSKVNIFVGANNNGKSLFLRYLSSLDEYCFVPNDIEFKIKIQKKEEHFFELLYQYDKVKSEKDKAEIKRKFDKAKCFIKQKLSISFKEALENVKLEVNEQNPEIESINSYLSSKIRASNIDYSLSQEKENYNFKKIYIPTLRGLRKPLIKGFLEDLKNKVTPDFNIVNELLKEYENLYEIRTKFDYFNKKNHRTLLQKQNDYLNPKEDTPEIFTGLDLYEEVKKQLLGNLNQRKSIRNFENFLSKSFFNKKEILLIPEYNSDVLHIKIGDEKERPIYELGDGIQSIIAMTFPLFNYPNENLLVFIEEPELFLHAGMQKTIIKTFLDPNRFENCQFFLVTHSNHIIDAINESDEISIYSVKKQFDLNTEINETDEKTPNFKIENLGHGNQNALSLLGVSSSSVYLANCTIWVEGITDKLYLSKFIEVYLNSKLNENYKDCLNFKDGLNYSFVYSAGDSIVYWEFGEDEEDKESEKILVKKLCSKAMVIVDNDNNKNPERKEIFRQKLGENFIELPVIEIENLLSIEVIKRTVKTYDTCSSIQDNEFKEINKNNHSSKRLGTLIDKYLLPTTEKSNRKKFSTYKKKTNGENEDENYTINKKVEFCRKAIDFIDPENMTEESKKIVESILDFIKKNNYL